MAGYTGAKSEILELLLPLKLYAGDNQVNTQKRNARYISELQSVLNIFSLLLRVFVQNETSKYSMEDFQRNLLSV